jgi:regulator of protease activity HflC (stomatin/prohibitin superfamily)
MGIFKKKYQVKPNTVGFLYLNNKFEKILNSGYYEIWDWRNRTELFMLPETSKLLTVTNQEVLTKDNVALRFSFNVIYKITDGHKFLSKFTLDKNIKLIMHEAEQYLYNIVQVYIRNRIAELDSETLNEKRNELTDFKTEEMIKEISEFGISIEQAQLRDLTFPKSIQDLFAKHLEAKIRAKSELENARTTVATARALKNASELMKDDDNIRFFQIIETISKIAEKGKHTFTIGDINQLTRNKGV